MMRKKKNEPQFNTGHVADMLHPANDELSADMRRYQRRLRVAGAGVLYFAIWGVIRMILLAVLTDDDYISQGLREVSSDPELGEHAVVGEVFFILLLGIFAVIDIMLRRSIYRGAKKDSLGLKKHRFYIVPAALMLIMSIVGIIAYIVTFSFEESSNASGGMSVVIELANAAALAELIHASFKLKKLRKQTEG